MKNKNVLLPISIVVAAVLIAGALIYSAGKNPSNSAGEQVADPGNIFAAVGEISPTEHIRGSVDASVIVVEYSDTECPYCKTFHETMKELRQVYGDKLAWVYRHFPIDSIHPKSRTEAHATECAAELGGNDAFWAYIDRVYETTPSNNDLDLNQLPEIAEYIGLDKAAFASCMESERYMDKIESQFQQVPGIAIAAGADPNRIGTPFSAVLLSNGEATIIPGALPFDQLKPAFDQIFAELEQ